VCVCVIFVLANCTSTLQPTNVILQCPFKYDLRNNVIPRRSTIKIQLEWGANPRVDFWMPI